MTHRFAFLLLGLVILLCALPLIAQDATSTAEPVATAEATAEAAVKYDPEACFVAAANNDKMVKFERNATMPKKDKVSSSSSSICIVKPKQERAKDATKVDVETKRV